jgi:hypothetical protein
MENEIRLAVGNDRPKIIHIADVPDMVIYPPRELS